MFSKEEFVKMINDQAENLSVSEKQDMFDAILEICYKNMTKSEFESRIFKYVSEASPEDFEDMMFSMTQGWRNPRMTGGRRRGIYRGMMGNMCRSWWGRRPYTRDEWASQCRDWFTY